MIKLCQLYIFLVSKTCIRKKEKKKNTPGFVKLISFINAGMKDLFSPNFPLQFTKSLDFMTHKHTTFEQPRQ